MSTQQRRIKVPPVQGRTPKKPPTKPPTLDRMLSDVRKGMNVQVNTFLAQFLDAHTDEELDAFLPEDVGEADAWIEGHFDAFVQNEDPTTDDMVDGLSALFMMTFLERLYEHCDIGTGEESDAGDEDEYEDDED